MVKICNWHLLQWLWRIRSWISQFRFCLTFLLAILWLLKLIAVSTAVLGLFDQKVAAKVLHISNCHISKIKKKHFIWANKFGIFFVEIHVKYFKCICKFLIKLMSCYQPVNLLSLCCFRNIIWKRPKKRKRWNFRISV